MRRERMGKGKSRSQKSETLSSKGEKEDERDAGEEEGGGRFFACYLLTSLSPRHKGHTYIGFTVNPMRRIRQHNGEMRSGAWRTKSKRPWEMALCIYGFPTNIAALQFEWAWQHPIESLAVRKAAVTFKSLSGIANKIKLAYTMLTLPSWQSLNLTVNFFSTKYKKHSAGCPNLPGHMKVQVCSMDELPCYTGDGQNVYENQEWDIGEECEEAATDYREVKEKLEYAIVHTSAGGQNVNGNDEWVAGEECEEWVAGEECDGLADGVVHNHLADQENREFEEACADYREVKETLYNSAHHRNSNKGKITPEFMQNIEKYCLKQPTRDSKRGYRRQPSSPHKSPELSLFLYATNSSQKAETDEELDQPAREMPTRIAADKDQPLVANSTGHCDVEVIDVFTPSPRNRINFRTKKRLNVCSEIIDLTKSPY